MAKSDPTWSCVHCAGELHPDDDDALVYGFDSTGRLYIHSGRCRAEAERRALNQDICRWCRRSFERHADPHRAGRKSEYCGDRCRRERASEAAKLWRWAARADLPRSVDECVARRNAVSQLWRDVRSGRFNGSSPSDARATLERYHARLEAHERELVTALHAERARSAAEGWKQDVEKQRAAHSDSWSIFLKGLDSDED